MHPQTPRAGTLTDRTDLIRRVQRTQLRALGDGDDLRHRPVLVVSAPGLAVDQLRRELAVRCGHSEQLEPAHALRRAAFVDVDVRAIGANDRTPSVGNRLKRNDVRAGSVEYRKYLRCRTEAIADDLLQVFGVHIIAVRALVPTVGQGQGGEHLGVYPRVVVACETANVRI